MRTAHFLTSLALLSLLPACIIVLDDGESWSYSGTQYVGSGVALTEARTVESFERVDLRGSTQLSVSVGASQLVEVTADDNLVPHVRTRVESGVLIVEMEKGSYSFRNGPRVRVVVPALQGVSLSGSGDATVTDLARGSFEASIAGSGTLRLRGTVDKLRATIAGSGDIEAHDLHATRVEVSIAGSGDVGVCASEALDVSIAGSGDVTYSGAVQNVSKSIAGSGSVQRR